MLASIRIYLLTTVAVCLLTCSSSWADKPNVIVILADDLGFSDLGCYGSEIETPHLDSLADSGLQFTNFYNTGRCWPTRASLLTGYYAQQVRRDKLENVKPFGITGKRPEWAPLVPELLKPAGYRSYHTGKWHIDSKPCAAGFDHSYLLGDQARFFSPQSIFIDDVQQPAVPRGTDYYATTVLADHAISVLQEHNKDHSDKPFFHYIAFSAPHFPLHALPQDIEKYSRRYDEGWEVLREQRWEQIQKRGLAEGILSPVERELGPPYDRPGDIKIFGPGEVNLPLDWDTLTEEQKRFQATKMAIHAAMIDRMDIEIGRIIEQLKTMGQFDNTLIIFLSDNGASAEIMIRDDGHDPDAAPGSADTHLCLGPGWSTVCNTPFRKHKTWVHEGGTATPLIAHWPAGIGDQGQLRSTPGHVIDIVPTILELAGLESKAIKNGPTPPGKSLLPVLRKEQSIEREMIWFSHENHRGIRVGNWKAVRTAGSKWELFDLKSDRAEANNLATTHSEKLAELVETWEKALEHHTRDALSEPPNDGAKR